LSALSAEVRDLLVKLKLKQHSGSATKCTLSWSVNCLR